MKQAERKTKMQIELSLPPSINASHITRIGSYKRIMTQEARNWMEQAGWLVKSQWKKPPMDDFFFIDLVFYLKNKQSDSHNYKKLLFDALEQGGLCTNDKYIKDRTQGVHYDKENPRVIITIQ